jgi:hypothetical protein
MISIILSSYIYLTTGDNALRPKKRKNLMIKIDCSFIFSLFENIFHYNVIFIILPEQVVGRRAKIAQIIFILFQTRTAFITEPL